MDTYSMGKIIRRLRKERNLTQEELAEQLNITSQAISKWENETGMPDISQIVPLASAFGVSTDVLFGTCGTSDAEEVQKIIHHAQSLITTPATAESIEKSYKALLEGLNRYPSNSVLLMQCLEKGLALAYPENDTYNEAKGQHIYKECIRQADVVISYDKNMTDVMRAHMIMVLLHSAYGNLEAAREHASKFPWRSDMTIHKMNAYIAHFEKDYRTEAIYRQRDFMYHLEAMLDDIVEIGCCYEALSSYENAQFTFSQALSLIGLVCEREEIIPSFHYRERGDIFALLAEVCLKMRKTTEAVQYLQRMVAHDTAERAKFQNDLQMKTPLLRDTGYPFYYVRPNIKEKLLAKLNNPAFDALRENEAFSELLETAQNMPVD